MKLTMVKIVGSAAGGSWSQTHVFRPDNAAKLASHGELLAAVSFKAKAEVETSSFGSEIIQRLQEIYYSHEAESVLTKLMQACETLAAEWLDQVELEIVAAAVWRDYLYAAKNAGGQVWLRRGGELVSLLVQPGLTSVSGRLEAGDVLAIVTSQLGELVPEGSLAAALGQNPEAAGESLTAQVHGHENNSRTAAVIVAVEPKAAGLPPAPRVSRWPVWDWLARFKPKKSLVIFAGGRPRRPRRSSLTVAVVLLVIFSFSLLAAGRKRQLEQRQAAAAAVIDEVSFKLEEANNLLTLNPLRAKSLLAESNTRIKEYKEKEKKSNQEILDLESKITAALEQTQREYSIDAVEWYDFDLVADGFRGNRWDLSGPEVLVVDPPARQAVLLNLETKAAKVTAAGEPLTGAKSAGLSEARGFIVSQNQVLVVDTAKDKIVAEAAADGWQNITTARGFGSNLYLLDSARESQIWKYLGLDDGLSGKRSYLAGETFDLSAAVDMAIDGSAWVLFSDGTIVKYTQGKKDAFAVIGLDQPFGEAFKIFTNPDVEHLYVIDRSNTRVVVLQKSGEYRAQYYWSGIAGVKDFAVSEELGKMFFLTGEKVFAVELK